jgi:hypothetical protein
MRFGTIWVEKFGCVKVYDTVWAIGRLIDGFEARLEFYHRSTLGWVGYPVLPSIVCYTVFWVQGFCNVRDAMQTFLSVLLV